MRFYRGLTRKYRAELVVPNGPQQIVATDFTDCPYAALSFARGPRGVMLVLDISEEESNSPRVSREQWGIADSGPKRFMYWGKFGDHIVARIPAKELRAHVRQKGVRTLSHDVKSRMLQKFIETKIHERNRAESSPSP
jgi:hypothetical protein